MRSDASHCPCCAWAELAHLRDVDSFPYFQCRRCEAIFIAPEHLDEIDAGRELRRYDLDYWTEELPAARERAYGSSLARMAEALYYARRPIRRFLDVGSGPGFFLDAVAKYLPRSAHVFYGVEKFPPPADRRTVSPRFLVGDLSDLELTFDGGICVEVAEHLTPNMLRGLVTQLGGVSTEGALYVFNTGMPAYVLHEDPAYLDPVRRGHVASYSVRSLEYLLEGTGFSAFPIRGKTWAFVLEYRSSAEPGSDVTDRVWSPLAENLAILDDAEMGTVLRVLGRETVLAYRR
jgi:SAM-dependent methyltransferase